MMITDNKYYRNLEKYIPNHLVLTLLSELDSTELEYLATENRTEYKLILKLKRITNYQLNQMIKCNDTSYGFKWEMIE